MADLHEAVMEVLKEPQTIYELVTENADPSVDTVRVYGVELPKAEIAKKLMPRKCIVVRQSGLGGQTGGYARFQKTLVDIICWGETPYEAELLRLEVHRFLKDFRRRMAKGFLLHSFDLVQGPLPLKDPDTDWPYVLCSWRVLASET